MGRGVPIGGVAVRTSLSERKWRAEMSLHQRRWAGLACSAGLAALLAAVLPGTFRGPDARADPGSQVAAAAEPAKAPADPALERTRGQVKMLDDLYKNAVV